MTEFIARCSAILWPGRNSAASWSWRPSDGRTRSGRADAIAMALAEQADGVARSVDDQGEEPGDVAAEDGQVEQRGIDHRRVAAAERNLTRAVPVQPNLRLDIDRSDHPAHAFNPFRGGQRGQPERVENILAQNRAVSAGVHQEQARNRRSIEGNNCTTNDWPNLTVGATQPLAVNSHRLE